MSKITEAEYRKLKKEVQVKAEQSQKAAGALDNLMARLKEDHECESLEEAKKLLKEYKKQRAKAEEEFESAFESYKNKWASDETEDGEEED